MSKQLAKNTYQKLLDEIAGIYDRALKDVHLAVEVILKTAYWKIGERIVEVEQDGSIRAQYGSRLLEQISSDMSKTNRKGFSVSNIKNMRQVYAAFSIRQISGELGWSHFVALSVVKDKKQRQAYLRKALEKKWTVEELETAFTRDQVKTILPDNGAAGSLPSPSSVGANSSPAKGEVLRLAFKRGVINAYRVIESKHDPKKDGGVWLDFGFRLSRKIKPMSGGSFKPGDVVAFAEVSEKATDLRKITSKDLKVDSLLYTYAARLARVIDGDTLKVEIKLGERMWTSKKLRLRRINTPEIDTAEGRKAKDFIIKRLKDCPWIVVKTYSTDIYDRYLVDVFYLPECDDLAKIALEGKLLNQELLDEGLAELWRTPDPLDLAMLN